MRRERKLTLQEASSHSHSSTILCLEVLGSSYVIQLLFPLLLLYILLASFEVVVSNNG